MKVKIKQSVANVKHGNLNVNQVIELAKKEAEGLISAGYAEEVKEEKKKAPKKSTKKKTEDTEEKDGE